LIFFNIQAWNSSGTEIITGSEDGYVSQFNVKKSLNTLRFQASVSRRKEPVHAVVLVPNNDLQLLVGTVAKITLWDLDTKTSIRMFEGGHRGNIVSIVFASTSMFLTVGASEQDHTVSLWSVKDESEVVHFCADETVKEAFAKIDDTNVQGMSIGVITKSGSLNYYEHNLNEPNKKKLRSTWEDLTHRRFNPPIVKPMSTIQLSNDMQDIILAAKFAEDKCIVLAHGTPSKPVFESVQCQQVGKSTCLVRPVATRFGNELW
jgi:WD40 repeat protein